jgi:hypothetical protein
MSRQVARVGIVTLIIVAILTSHVPRFAAGQGDSQPAYIIVEDFDDSADFMSTSSNVFISDGLAYWNVARNGGQQFVYRSIPAFIGDVTLIVRGQVDSWTNNCAVKAGVGDSPGNGVSVNFGFTGGGCSASGPLVTGNGATLDYYETSCQFNGNWLWIEPDRPYTAIFTLSMGIAQLAVSGVGASVGTPTYTGPFTTLYVGLNGDGDWPSCAGTIDMIMVIGGQVNGLTNVSIDPADAESMVRGFLRADAQTILQGIDANLDSFDMPVELAAAMALGYWLGGPWYSDGVSNAVERYMPNCLPPDRFSGTAQQATTCVELWRQAGDIAYSEADIAIEEWFRVATLEGARNVVEGTAVEIATRVMSAWSVSLAGAKLAGAAAAAVTGAKLFAIFGWITGLIHLENVRQAGLDALIAVTNVWITELGYTAAQDYYNRMQ